ncbi:MAG: AAC(3) family N-acetyltransferase [Synergistaceae bacterium]|jgi:aminoglycoside 3-N-acetyltransferase|nr:AAC(3) family N-acetyltransferase [Synergistaceae bacterium]
MFTSPAELTTRLSAIFDELSIESLCLHTDLTPIGPLEGAKTRAEQLKGYADVLLSALSGRIFLLPTFSYSYPKTRVYDVQKDPCEVGILNEYFRKSTDSRRTRAPVFNFCVLNDRENTFNYGVLADPFSSGSVFAQMTEYRTWMGFLGTTLTSVSFMHYVEHVADVGYRYYKSFPGKVVDGNFEVPVDFGYKVRVLHPDFVNENDWGKIDRDMVESGLLRKYSLGNGELLLFRCDLAFPYWSDLLRKDDLYVFTERARRSIEALKKRVGYPFTLEMFEAPQ